MFNRTSTGLFALALAATLSLPLAAQAATYDATADFVASQTSNPNGVWSYGWDEADSAGNYTFTAFDLPNGSTTTPGWRATTHNVDDTPAFFYNATSSTLGTVGGIAPGQIALHPAEDQYGFVNDNAAILRFTAPTAGNYTVNAQFFAGDSDGINYIETEAWIVQNDFFGAPIATLGLTSFNPTFISTLTLAAGDTLDFVVGNGPDTHYYDTTPLTVVITTPVPEPEGILLALAGLGVLALRASRKR